MTHNPHPPSRRARLVVALAVGAAFGLYAATTIGHRGYSDFEAPYAGARAWLAGSNPYALPPAAAVALYGGTGLFYPLPALWLVAPLAQLPLPVAGALYVGVAYAALTYRLTRDAWWRLWAVANAPAVYAASLGQWTPLLLLGALSPAAGALLVVKPSVGLALWAARPSWRVAAMVAGVLALSVAVLPSWPAAWLAGARASPQHVAPLLRPAGGILLLALLRWRTPGGRLLAALAAIPHQTMFYDQVVLFTIPDRPKHAMALSAVMSVGVLAWAWAVPHWHSSYQTLGWPFTLAFAYLPALWLVLRHPPRANGFATPAAAEPGRELV